MNISRLIQSLRHVVPQKYFVNGQKFSACNLVLEDCRKKKDTTAAVLTPVLSRDTLQSEEQFITPTTYNYVFIILLKIIM